MPLSRRKQGFESPRERQQSNNLVTHAVRRTAVAYFLPIIRGEKILWEMPKQSEEPDRAGSETGCASFRNLLDSLGPLREPSWADVLPAFSSSFDRIIGHFHLPQRGLRQWRKFLNGYFHSESGRGFQEFFTDAAAQCDAVILTSSALVESDLRCDPCASTEELTGKLMRDLGLRATHARGARPNCG